MPSSLLWSSYSSLHFTKELGISSCSLDKAKSSQPVKACIIGVGRAVLQPLPCSSMSSVCNQTGSGSGSGQGKEKGLQHSTAPSLLGIVLCSFLKSLFSAEAFCHHSSRLVIRGLLVLPSTEVVCAPHLAQAT